MLAAVHFYRQFLLPVDEVCEVGADRVLTYEFVAAEVSCFQQVPEGTFGWVVALAQGASSFYGPGIVGDDLHGGGPFKLKTFGRGNSVARD